MRYPTTHDAGGWLATWASRHVRPALLAVAILAALPAGAVDGVLEINQACAVNTGCFPGDAAGFPVTLTAAGSYRLTGNLQATAVGVSISAAHVTLDLNGFVIDGSGAAGLINGVSVTAANAEIRNGTVRSFTRDGIRVEAAAGGARMIGLRVFSNGNDGFNIRSTRNLVDGCRAESNSSSDIVVFSSASAEILDSTAGSLFIFGGGNVVAIRSNVFDSVMVDGASTLIELGPNQCGNDTTCP
jgi:hypothetical protein